MKVQTMCVGLALVAGALGVQAAEGLVAPAAESVWPQWQARIALQTTSVSPLTTSRLIEGAAPQRGLQGGAVFGDYYFANPSYGSFRASGGLLMGLQGGLPMNTATAGPRLGLALNNGVALPVQPGAESLATLPYLGLGFTGAAWLNGLAISADLGMVAERPAAAGNVGRALFGNQGFDGAVRELRLSPVLQLGMRYTF